MLRFMRIVRYRIGRRKEETGSGNRPSKDACRKEYLDVSFGPRFDPLLDVGQVDDVVDEGGQVGRRVENVWPDPVLESGHELSDCDVGPSQLKSDFESSGKCFKT